MVVVAMVLVVLLEPLALIQNLSNGGCSAAVAGLGRTVVRQLTDPPYMEGGK